MDKSKSLKRRRVFTPDLKDQTVMISQNDFSRLQVIIDSLSNIPDLQELHECTSIIFHVSMENYINDLRLGLKEMHDIFVYYNF